MTTARYTAAHWGAYRIEGDKIVPLAEDPAPSRIGEGWVSASRDLQSRILRPAIRSGWLNGDGGAGRGADTFVQVPWDEALDATANALKSVRDAHGNQAIFAGSYGWASAGRFHHAQSQMRRFFNLIGGFVSSRDTYSHAAAEVLWPLITGLSNDEMQRQTTSWSMIADHAELVVAFGGISTRTAQVTSSGTSQHDGGWVNGLTARKLNISPQRSDWPGAEWWPIRPGTDTALILALCHSLLQAGLQDEAFLARCTSGWPTFRTYLTGEADGQAKSAEWAGVICDIEPGQIRQLAQDMGHARTLVALPWGMQRAHHGEQPIWAGLALAAMLGQIGKAGTGYAFGLGSLTSVGRPSRHTSWPSLPVGRNLVADYIPVARLTEMLEQPGGRYTYNLETRHYPDIRLVYWTGGNPFHHHQDLRRLERAWRGPETVIVQDHSWTATARRADIVLPATSPLERHDIMMSRADPRLIYMSPLQDAPGEARDDYAIFAELAQRFGVDEAFREGRDTQGWLRWMWQAARDRAAAQGTELPNFDAFRELGQVSLPDLGQPRVFLDDFTASPEDHPLPTDTGRIMLYHPSIATASLPDCLGHPAWLEPYEWLGNARPHALHLISGQPDTRLHAQNDRGAASQADKISGREPCVIHPDTAASHGIKDGAILRIWNDRGACLAGARLSHDIRPDCIALATGAWYDPAEIDGQWLELAGNPNALTRDQGSSGLSQGTSAHTTLVQIERWDAPLPPLSTNRPPLFENP